MDGQGRSQWARRATEVERAAALEAAREAIGELLAVQTFYEYVALLERRPELAGPQAVEALRDASQTPGYGRLFVRAAPLLESGDPSTAWAAFQEGTDRAEQMAQALKRLDAEAQVANEAGDHARALDLIDQALPIAEEIGYGGAACELLNQRGLAYFNLRTLNRADEVDAAIEAFEAALGVAVSGEQAANVLMDEVLIRSLTLAELQSQFICDGIIRTGTPQSNDRSLSPVAVAFAKQEGLIDPYVKPTTQQLFDFTSFYVDWYRSGPGQGDPGANARWQNAARVHFNIETKLNPRSDRDDHGEVYRARSVGPVPFAERVAGVIESNGVADRADVESFDWRTLRRVAQEHPDLQTVELFGDFPVFADTSVAGTDDGTNLQPQAGEANTRWLAGLYWPWRHTVAENPFRAETSGGFEGMAITPNGRSLRPMLEKTLTGAPAGTTQIFDFDLRHPGYTADRWTYPYDPCGVSIGDFQLVDPRHGLVIERDNTQGDLGGLRRSRRSR
jgi:tetratricopeptide (TPR) repeat protein